MKLGDPDRQNKTCKNAMFFVVNLLSSSRAGRRGFESRLLLHLFSDTYSRPVPLATPKNGSNVTRYVSEVEGGIRIPLI